MIRTTLSGAIAAATLACAAPAFATETPIEFLRNEAKEQLQEGRASTKEEAPSKKESKASAPQSGSLRALVKHYAAQHGVPADLAHGVVMVESRYKANATGPGGYIGLMQLSYRTAQGMGYKGSRAALYEPHTNLRYGMRYLGEAYRQAGGNWCGTVSKYQGGHGVRGVTKAGAVYCGKVKKYMAQSAPGEKQIVVASREGGAS